MEWEQRGKSRRQCRHWGQGALVGQLCNTRHATPPHQVPVLPKNSFPSLPLSTGGITHMSLLHITSHTSVFIISLSIHLSIYLSVCLSAVVSISLLHPSISPPVNPSIRPRSCVCQSRSAYFMPLLFCNYALSASLLDRVGENSAGWKWLLISCFSKSILL